MPTGHHFMDGGETYIFQVRDSQALPAVNTVTLEVEPCQSKRLSTAPSFPPGQAKFPEAVWPPWLPSPSMVPMPCLGPGDTAGLLQALPGLLRKSHTLPRASASATGPQELPSRQAPRPSHKLGLTVGLGDFRGLLCPM